MKELSLRMTENIDVDYCGSPHLLHMAHCVEIIEEVEADHKGQKDEKYLSENEKYKLGIQYMQMLEDPSQFKFLERLTGGDAEQIRMNLNPQDIVIHE